MSIYNECRQKIPKVYKYGMIKDRDISSIFGAMVRRCYDEKNVSYPSYGGRGIRICIFWRKHPDQFEQWALSNNYKKGLTVDRINSDGEYCPDNCRLISKSENAKWQRKTHRITINGIIDSATGWEKRLGFEHSHINNMIRKNGIEQTVEVLRQNIDKNNSGAA